jgi:hypothetical protein
VGAVHTRGREGASKIFITGNSILGLIITIKIIRNINNINSSSVACAVGISVNWFL